MNKESTIIAISGFARSGKDTFCDLLLKSNARYKRYAFADKLKNDLRLFLMEQCRLDVSHLEGHQKELVRPLLIAYGKMMRDMSNGLHWVLELEKQILSDLQFDDNLGASQTIPVITDFRYLSEIEYFKSRYNLIVVEVSRDGAPTPPEEERINQPLVRPHVNYTVNWPTVGENNLHTLNKYAEDFIKHYNLV